MITHAFAQAGYQVAEPRDLLVGHDLREPAEQRAVLQQIDELEPGPVFVGFDCGYWTTLARATIGQTKGRISWSDYGQTRRA